MKKYIVETYYTCTFKTIHTLNELDDTELSKINDRSDGEVEVIDVKLNNRKTRKSVAKKKRKIRIRESKKFFKTINRTILKSEITKTKIKIMLFLLN